MLTNLPFSIGESLQAGAVHADIYHIATANGTATFHVQSLGALGKRSIVVDLHVLAKQGHPGATPPSVCGREAETTHDTSAMP